eukprot:scaffold1294_cov167-Amphora_coffeaeformis.AAC.20
MKSPTALVLYPTTAIDLSVDNCAREGRISHCFQWTISVAIFRLYRQLDGRILPWSRQQAENPKGALTWPLAPQTRAVVSPDRARSSKAHIRLDESCEH